MIGVRGRAGLVSRVKDRALTGEEIETGSLLVETRATVAATGDATFWGGTS
jgi:hypothetical protein